MPELAPVTMQFFPSIRVSISSDLNFFECSLQCIYFNINYFNITQMSEWTTHMLLGYIKQHWKLTLVINLLKMYRVQEKNPYMYLKCHGDSDLWLQLLENSLPFWYHEKKVRTHKIEYLPCICFTCINTLNIYNLEASSKAMNS